MIETMVLLQEEVLHSFDFVTNKYLQSLFIIIGFFLAARLFVFVIDKVITRLTSKTKTNMDDEIRDVAKSPVYFMMIAFGIRFALIPLGLNTKFEEILGTIIYSIITFLFASATIKVVNIIIEHVGKKITKKTKSTIDDHLLELSTKTLRVFGMIIAGLFVLDLWGIKVGPLLAGLGIGGLAVAFALQPTLANIFGGVALIIDKTLKPGDIVEVDGYSGKIIDIGIRSTKIQTWDNEAVIIPNGKLVDSTIKNISKPNTHIRVVIPFGVAYGSDIDKAKKIVLTLIKKVEGVMDEPEPVIRFMEMANSSLNFKAFFHVDELGQKWPAIDFMNCNIYKEFQKAKVEIPFPQMDVHLKKK